MIGILVIVEFLQGLPLFLFYKIISPLEFRLQNSYSGSNSEFEKF
jgi:hypothetical protein